MVAPLSAPLQEDARIIDPSCASARSKEVVAGRLSTVFHAAIDSTSPLSRPRLYLRASRSSNQSAAVIKPRRVTTNHCDQLKLPPAPVARSLIVFAGSINWSSGPIRWCFAAGRLSSSRIFLLDWLIIVVKCCEMYFIVVFSVVFGTTLADVAGTV